MVNNLKEEQLKFQKSKKKKINKKLNMKKMIHKFKFDFYKNLIFYYLSIDLFKS